MQDVLDEIIDLNGAPRNIKGARLKIIGVTTKFYTITQKGAVIEELREKSGSSVFLEKTFELGKDKRLLTLKIENLPGDRGIDMFIDRKGIITHEIHTLHGERHADKDDPFYAFTLRESGTGNTIQTIGYLHGIKSGKETSYGPRSG